MTSFIDPHAVSAFVVCNKKYLLIHRCSSYLPGTWQMVSGGIHKGETAWDAAIREIKEETGLTPDKLYSADAVETFYMLSRNQVTIVPVFVAFVSHLEVTLAPQEHDAYEWLPFEEAQKRLVFSEQRRVIAHVHENFVLKDPLPLFFIC